MDKIIAIIPASGIGTRFNYFKPKQYFSFLGKTILEYTIQLLAQNLQIDLIVLNIQSDDTYYNEINFESKFIKIINDDANFKLTKRTTEQCPLVTIRQGGHSRSSTIKNALEFLQKNNLIIDQDWILVHDAVRCTLPANLLELFINKIKLDKIGGIMAIPITDTLKKVVANKVVATITRENIYQAQTPQMFKALILIKAFTNPDFLQYTDESSLVESLNITPTIVLGSIANLKLTNHQDIVLISLLLKAGRDV